MTKIYSKTELGKIIKIDKEMKEVAKSHIDKNSVSNSDVKKFYVEKLAGKNSLQRDRVFDELRREGVKNKFYTKEELYRVEKTFNKLID